MSRYKQRFTLHQVYAYYAHNGDLNWRRAANAAMVSTRTMRNYFENAEQLAERLVEYHLKHLENFYTNSRVAPSKDLDRQLRTVRTLVQRNLITYLFSDKAFKQDLTGRGQEIKQTHLGYIRNAMLHGGVKEEKAKPELVFDFFLRPLPDGQEGKDLIIHWMKWFMAD